MEEDMLSLISTAKTDGEAEISDSNGGSFPVDLTTSKRRKIDGNYGYGPTPRFKGVVPQQNGHWGAQIYANHQRVWLGTFKTEREAAAAYDSAAVKLRSGDSHRNFRWTSRTVHEPAFQKLYTTEEVLNMIKDGSYPLKFADFLRTTARSKRSETGIGQNVVKVNGGNGGFLCRQLFQKELTPSDVGKLNRLVIPKKYAVKYFPQISECEKNEQELCINNGGGGVDDLLLLFYDKLMRSWKFRYCYWRSSQSFVFTRGWNRFVKEKKLKAKDVVTFYLCERKDNACTESQQPFCLIDVSYSVSENNGPDNGSADMKKELIGEKDLGRNYKYGECVDEEDVVEEVEEEAAVVDTDGGRRGGIKLFGVQIF